MAFRPREKDWDGCVKDGVIPIEDSQGEVLVVDKGSNEGENALLVDFDYSSRTSTQRLYIIHGNRYHCQEPRCQARNNLLKGHSSTTKYACNRLDMLDTTQVHSYSRMLGILGNPSDIGYSTTYTPNTKNDRAKNLESSTIN